MGGTAMRLRKVTLLSVNGSNSEGMGGLRYGLH
jgi:hypothetical protein